MSDIINKKLHPYYKTGIYGWIGEEVDDNDYIICPICGDVLGMNYWDYSAENNGDNKCPKCKQELDYSEIYEFGDTCYYEQLVEMKNQKISDLEAKLAESESRFQAHKQNDVRIIQDQTDLIENLEQQVKEKEKKLAEYSDINNALNSGLQERCISCEEEHNQDKISFAVELLEKVKNRIESKVESVYKRLDDLNIKIVCESTSRQLSTYEEIVKEIDNQIKQLKEGK